MFKHLVQQYQSCCTAGLLATFLFPFCWCSIETSGPLYQLLFRFLLCIIKNNFGLVLFFILKLVMCIILKIITAFFLFWNVAHHGHISIEAIFRAVDSSLLSSLPVFEGHPLHVRHKQDWGRGFILLLPQTAALLESDADSDVIKPASSFVIKNRQTSCSIWCSMYRARS